ncbi:MAG: thiamine-phosphate kinase [Phycisphaerae bacterium]
MRELDFIKWITRQSRFDPARVPIGPGDDMAVVKCGAEDLLITIDQVLDGVHFLLEEHGPRLAGRKAMARNLSDVAAMAAEPLAAVASVALPKGTDEAVAREIYGGIRELGDRFHCPLVGGDLGTWDQKLAISLTLFARPGTGRPVLRSGAKPGDAICVTGKLGGAWRTRRHLEFIPRVEEAQMLSGAADLHAMIDLSDGLATDLGHICRASGVGAELTEPAIPIHPDAATGISTEDRGEMLSRALTDGEDHELCFTLPQAEADKLVSQPPCEVELTKIGRIVDGKGIQLIAADGSRSPVDKPGWEHLA